ncbi:MAG TPA: phosphopyruvate hydratase [Usitatibacter sp.]|nr:phosphopyruvate hydratase [Usitatibacter sp.]
MKTRIQAVHGREVLDSRGRPTVEAEVTLADGSRGAAIVPSGASTGRFEAHELRDGDPSRYGGLGVRTAVGHVRGEIAGALASQDAQDQRAIDEAMRALDGTPNLARLGANATLAVSLAACRAVAQSQGRRLYERVAELSGAAPSLPVPMVNILSGGLHAGRGMDFQDFLAMPARAGSIAEAIEIVGRVRTAAIDVSKRRGLPTLLADEGGLSPGLESGREALRMMVESIEVAGLRPGEDVSIAIDVAASTLVSTKGYGLEREGRDCSAAEMVEMLEAWVREFPVVSIEDGLGEEDWEGWRMLGTRLRDRVQLVGDDLFTTHPQRLQRGIERSIANGILVKANQNGTLTGTLDVIAQARAAGYATIVSARSGETEDAFMSDLAVGAAAGQIKIGSLRTSSTVAKYNQLLRIEEWSGAPYAGFAAVAGRRT